MTKRTVRRFAAAVLAVTAAAVLGGGLAAASAGPSTGQVQALGPCYPSPPYPPQYPPGCGQGSNH
jgi:hypothetical protein